jgi:hypothetical protein
MCGRAIVIELGCGRRVKAWMASGDGEADECENVRM